MRKALAALALPALLALGGCVSVIHRNEGNDIDFEQVESLEVGVTTLAETLERLGSPLVYERNPDGLLVVYKTRRYRYVRYGFEPGRMVSVFPPAAPVADTLENFSVVVGHGKELEQRVAILFDSRFLVAAVAVSDQLADDKRANKPPAPPAPDSTETQ